ncbi:MAG: hypothetical protein ACON3Z_13565 [Bradymonadia bacterium]
MPKSTAPADSVVILAVCVARDKTQTRLVDILDVDEDGFGDANVRTVGIGRRRRS